MLVIIDRLPRYNVINSRVFHGVGRTMSKRPFVLLMLYLGASVYVWLAIKLLCVIVILLLLFSNKTSVSEVTNAVYPWGFVTIPSFHTNTRPTYFLRLKYKLSFSLGCSKIAF